MEKPEVLQHLLVGYRPPERLGQEVRKQPSRVGFGCLRHHPEVAARQFWVGGFEGEIPVEHLVAAGRPFFDQGSFDFDPLNHCADSAHHRPFVGKFGNGPVRGEPQGFAGRHPGLKLEFAELDRAHFEVMMIRGKARAWPVGEPGFQNDPSVRPFGVRGTGKRSGPVNHRFHPEPEPVPAIGHGWLPCAEFSMWAVEPVPADGEEAFWRMDPGTELERRMIPVVPGFVVIRLDPDGLGPCSGHRGLLERKVRCL